MDLYDKRDIKPMLIKDQVAPFDSDEYIFELKFDGSRCLAYLDKKSKETELINKRQMILTPIFPELKELHKQVKQKCILDGELFVMRDGKPDFELENKRTHMTNTFKIELEAKKHPASFVAFDILYYKDKDVTGLPLLERKKLLEKAVHQNEQLAVALYVENEGKDLFELTRQQGLEGIVAKKKTSRYHFDIRTKDWLKIKNMEDDDFVVCGYIRKEKGVISLVLGQYTGRQLVYKGHVTGISRAVFETISSQPSGKNPFKKKLPPSNDNAVWIKPNLVCKVEYMYLSEKGSMRQPAFRGLRDDKKPRECIARDRE